MRVSKKPRSHLIPRRRVRSASAIARSINSGQFGAIQGFAGLLLRLRPTGLALRATPSAPLRSITMLLIFKLTHLEPKTWTFLNFVRSS
jgi:hypothetical protein